jgi:hypothetical protein
MAQYEISGVWKDSNGVITHYTIHEEKTGWKGVKTSKSDALKLIDTPHSKATTIIWNYKTSNWVIGEPVHVVDGSNGKFLRSNPDGKASDNLAHLINFEQLKL